MFSVVVPVWNKRPFLAATVGSILAQSYSDFELIAVDDGSDDGSYEWLTGVTDHRLRIVRQARAGGAAARNVGIAAARHDWIAFLDADDLWRPDHLAELDRVRVRYPTAGLIGTAYEPIAAGAVPALTGRGQGRLARICFFDRIARGQPVFNASSTAIRRETWQDLGGFRDVFGTDREYWARIAFERPIAVSTRATVFYRLGTGGECDSAIRRWADGRLQDRSDLSDSVAFALTRYATLKSARRRRAIEAYCDRYVQIRLLGSAAIGDIATIRRLPALYFGRPSATARFLLAISRLPPPLARAIFAFARRVKSRINPLSPLRAPGSAAVGRPHCAAESRAGRNRPAPG